VIGPTPNGAASLPQWDTSAGDDPRAAGAAVLLGRVELLRDGQHVAYGLALINTAGEERVLWWDRYASPPHFRTMLLRDLPPMGRT
jgi:hypothetical protein